MNDRFVELVELGEQTTTNCTLVIAARVDDDDRSEVDASWLRLVALEPRDLGSEPRLGGIERS